MRIKKKIYLIGTVLLATTCFFYVEDRSAAVNYDSKIESAQEEKKEYKKKAATLQKDIEALEQNKGNALEYIEKLDKKVSEVEADWKDTTKKISGVDKKLAASKEELAQAQEEEQKQYATMKKRIKYMYENGNEEYISILFSSESLTDLLNRTEYIEKISAYDKNIFDEYKKTKDNIAAKTKEIEDAKTKLEGMKTESEAEKSALQTLKKKKKAELKKYNAKLQKSQDKANEYSRQAAQAEAAVEKLLEQKQDEINKLNDAGSGNSGGSDGTLRWPLNTSGRVSSAFGHRSSPTAGASSYHKGIDIATSAGTAIVAAGSGKVVTAMYSSSAGNYIMISHGNRLYTVYMHCSRLAVSVGDTVSKGQTIGYVGSTGISTGAHLHFGISKNGAYVNPLSYVSR